MKLFKKVSAVVLAAVLSLGILQISSVAYGAPGPIDYVDIRFNVPAEGDISNPAVVGIPEGVICDGISFMTAEKVPIIPHDMREGKEYYAVIKLRADVNNGYSFYNEGNEPGLKLYVNDADLNIIYGGMPAGLQDGYFVTNPAASAPYNNITIYKKFEAQKRVYSYFDAQIVLEGDKKIKVGETVKLIVSKIDQDKDRIVEYNWEISDGVERKYYKIYDEDTFDFTPDKPGTYSIKLAQIKLDRLDTDGSVLSPKSLDPIVITVVADTTDETNGEQKTSATGVPKTGDGFEMNFWLIMFALSVTSFTVIISCKRKAQ